MRLEASEQASFQQFRLKRKGEKKTLDILYIESSAVQNHRIIEVGKDLQNHQI